MANVAITPNRSRLIEGIRSARVELVLLVKRKERSLLLTETVGRNRRSSRSTRNCIFTPPGDHRESLQMCGILKFGPVHSGTRRLSPASEVTVTRRIVTPFGDYCVYVYTYIQLIRSTAIVLDVRARRRDEKEREKRTEEKENKSRANDHRDRDLDGDKGRRVCDATQILDIQIRHSNSASSGFTRPHPSFVI